MREIDVQGVPAYRWGVTKGVVTRMSFLRRLFGGGGEQAKEDPALHLYIKCNRCGTPVHVRVDLNNDLAADYGDTAAEAFTLSKDVMDDRCFRMMRLSMQFDARRKEVSRQIEGGTFVTEAEWEDLRSQAPQRRGTANRVAGTGDGEQGTGDTEDGAGGL